jgi:hypothetical protein
LGGRRWARDALSQFVGIGFVGSFLEGILDGARVAGTERNPFFGFRQDSIGGHGMFRERLALGRLQKLVSYSKDSSYWKERIQEAEAPLNMRIA